MLLCGTPAGPRNQGGRAPTLGVRTTSSAIMWAHDVVERDAQVAVDSPPNPGYNQLRIGGHAWTVGIDFEWDPTKAAQNLQKHSVTFEEAATVFRDHLSITVPDPDHSLEEERFITVGLSGQNRLLVIAHMDRGDCIRIISARELTPRERRQYEEASSNG